MEKNLINFGEVNQPLQVLQKTNLLGKELTVYGTAENPLFLAKEVAEWIEYDPSSVNKMVNTVDDEEKVRNIIPTPGGNQEMWTLTEDGLYEVLLQSRKPIAKQFKKGVKKILHELRTNGSVSVASLSRKELAMMVIKAEEERERLALENKQQAEVIEEQKPKVVFADAIIGSQSSCLVGELAKIITQNGYKIGQNRLFEWLRKNHFLGTSGEYYNIPNQKYVEQGLFELKKTSHSENGVMRTTVTPKVTGKGQQYFVNLFLKNDMSLFTNSDFED